MRGGSELLHTHVTRRLVDTFAQQGGCINKRLGGPENVSRHGVQGQLGQVCPHSHAAVLLARDREDHDQLNPYAGSRQRPSDTSLCRGGVLFSHVLSPLVGGPVGLLQLCGPNPSTGPPETPTADAGGQPEHPAPPVRPFQADNPSTPQLVASLAPSRAGEH